MSMCEVREWLVVSDRLVTMALWAAADDADKGVRDICLPTTPLELPSGHKGTCTPAPGGPILSINRRDLWSVFVVQLTRWRVTGTWGYGGQLNWDVYICQIKSVQLVLWKFGGDLGERGGQ